MMKRYAVGIFELLIVIILVIIIYFTCFHSQYGRKHPFADNSKINSQQELIDTKLQEIENTKALKKQIGKNLYEGNE